jgi:hypothetical protein
MRYFLILILTLPRRLQYTPFPGRAEIKGRLDNHSCICPTDRDRVVACRVPEKRGARNKIEMLAAAIRGRLPETGSTVPTAVMPSVSVCRIGLAAFSGLSANGSVMPTGLELATLIAHRAAMRLLHPSLS